MTLPLPKPHTVHIAPPRIAGWAESPTGIPFVHERRGDADGPEVFISCLVHGNEYSGAIVLDELLGSGFVPQRGRLTAVFCNVAAFERFDPDRPDASRFIDEDFNRVWSTEVLAGPRASAELSRAREIRPLVQRATHLLDLHSMHEPCEPLMVTGLLPRNVSFAQRMGAGVQAIVDAGHEDGVRMRDFGPFALEGGDRISLLFEAGQHWELDAVRAARNVLMRFLVAAGALDRDRVPRGWLLPDTPAPAPVLVTDRVVARSLDFAFVQDFRGGETIHRAGTLIARDASQPVLTPYDDCVLVMPSVRQLRPGVTTVRLGRRVPDLGL